jgi:hypothetical protein
MRGPCRTRCSGGGSFFVPLSMTRTTTRIVKAPPTLIAILDPNAIANGCQTLPPEGTALTASWHRRRSKSFVNIHLSCATSQNDSTEPIRRSPGPSSSARIALASCPPGIHVQASTVLDFLPVNLASKFLVTGELGLSANRSFHAAH